MSSGARSDGRSGALAGPPEPSGYPRFGGPFDDSWKTLLTRHLADLYRPASALGQYEGNADGEGPGETRP